MAVRLTISTHVQKCSYYVLSWGLEVSRNLEEVLRSWSEGPSKTEQAKCDNAQAAVRKALANSSKLAARRVEVFAQGSYRNATNVRQESDVDVCVRLMDTFFYVLPEGVTATSAGISPSEYLYSTFKDEVGEALRSHFGSAAVLRGNKAFDIHENTYRIDADVVATFEHRRYFPNGPITLNYWSGTELRPDSGGRIINWPQQNYDNGVAKNGQTAGRFKRLVRMIKNLRNEMAEGGVTEAQPIPSYLIECLAWKVPNYLLGHATYTEDLRASLAHLLLNTETDAKCHEWGEENELKYLFRPAQAWTRQDTYRFLLRAWTYVGF